MLEKESSRVHSENLPSIYLAFWANKTQSEVFVLCGAWIWFHRSVHHCQHSAPCPTTIYHQIHRPQSFARRPIEHQALHSEWILWIILTTLQAKLINSQPTHIYQKVKLTILEIKLVCLKMRLSSWLILPKIMLLLFKMRSKAFTGINPSAHYTLQLSTTNLGKMVVWN